MAVVVWIALGTVAVHLATGWRYGFDRDELMALDDARNLAWGYVQYPPMTAFWGWIALKLFGTSLGGFRLFASLAQAVALVLTGLMAKEMAKVQWRGASGEGRGEKGVIGKQLSVNSERRNSKTENRSWEEEPEAQVHATHLGRPWDSGEWAMVVTTLAGVPFCLGAGALMQYISFDYVCWVWVAYCVVRVVGAENRKLKFEKRNSEEEPKTHAHETSMGHPTQIDNSVVCDRKKSRSLAGLGMTDLESSHFADFVRNDNLFVGGGGQRRKAAATGGERWWVGVGMGMGLGMLAKYTMGFLAVGVVVGVLATDARRYLRSVWLWAGVGLAWVIFLPNLVWEWRRDFVSLDFLKFLHARDVSTGVTDWFLLGQLELTMLMAPLAMAGLWFCFRGGVKEFKSATVEEEELPGQEANLEHTASGLLESEEHRQECLCQKRWRILGWMYVVPLVLFLVMRGRDYYLAPAYPMLYAAGAVWVEKKSRRVEEYKRVRGTAAICRKVIWVALALDIVAAGAVALPIAPIGTKWWDFAAKVDVVFPDEIGWRDFVAGVAKVRDGLPAEDRERVGILAGNYGEVGALNLYGEKYGLPRAMSGVNSSWERGYGDPPEVLIVVGYPRELLEEAFASVAVAGRTRNRYGVANEETVEVPEIYVCRGMKESWEKFWGKVRKFA